MKFCPKCGSMILPKRKDGNIVIECSCGYNETGVKDIKITSATNNAKIETVTNKVEENTLPICDMKCESCANPKSYFWEIQTRASDEPPTRFYKCTKCSHTWREYS